MFKFFSLLLILVFSLSYADEKVKNLLSRLNLISADVFLYKSYKDTEIITLGKYGRIYTFILNDGEIIHVSDNFPQIQKERVYIGKFYFDLKTGKLQKVKDNDTPFKIIKKKQKYYLFYIEKNKKRLRFKADYIKLFKSGKFFFFLSKRENRYEVYYLFSKRFFPRLIKRGFSGRGYDVKVVNCQDSFFVVQTPLELEKPAFILYFDSNSKTLSSKLMVKRWNYTLSGCYKNKIVLSDGDNFYLLSNSGLLEEVKKVEIDKPTFPIYIKEIKIGKIESFTKLDNFFILRSEGVFKVYNLDLNEVFSFKKGFTDFYEVNKSIFALEREKGKFCIFRIDNPIREMFCKDIPESSKVLLSKAGIYVLDKRGYVRIYSYYGKLLLKEKLKQKNLVLTDFGIFYINGALTRIKPNGDYEVYDIKPKKIFYTGGKVVIRTDKQHFIFDGKKFLRLEKNCEPFYRGKVCFNTVFYFIKGKNRYIFLEKPIYYCGGTVVSIETVGKDIFLKLFSLKDKKIVFFRNLKDTNGFVCFKNKVLIFKENGLISVSF